MTNFSPASEIGGAVNTVVNDNGVLTGYTTDGIGFMRAVSETGVDIIGKKMTLLGAGGAAAAILIQAALDKVAEISVFNIRDEFFTRAEKTIEKLHEKTDCKINLYDFSDPEVLEKGDRRKCHSGKRNVYRYGTKDRQMYHHR